jgi:hypothetical protein
MRLERSGLLAAVLILSFSGLPTHVQFGRLPTNTEDTAHDTKRDHAFVRVRHNADPFTDTAATVFESGVEPGSNIF